MLQPEKVATPVVDPGVTGAHVNVAPEDPVPLVMVSETCDVFPVTGLPLESSSVTEGCVEKGEPPVPFPGSWVKSNWAGGPAVTLKAVAVVADDTPDSEGSVAVSL